MEMPTPRFPIGTVYTTRGRHPRCCTVTDIITAYNSRGELVSTRYVATHELMGRIITEHGICETTIAMGSPTIPVTD